MTAGDSQCQRKAPEADLDEEVLDPGDPVEEARGLRAALRRHAVDTRPVRIRDYRRLLVGQGTAFIGSMVTGRSSGSWFRRVMHISFGIPLISAEQEPHFPALQFHRTARSPD